VRRDCSSVNFLIMSVRNRVTCDMVGRFSPRIEAPVFISANGGYRSPAHQMAAQKAFMPGERLRTYTGSETLSFRCEVIERYGAVAASLSPAVFVRPFARNTLKPTTIFTSIRICDADAARMQRGALISYWAYEDLGTVRRGRFLPERAAFATPPRTVIGLEAEFNLLVNGRRRRPERSSVTLAAWCAGE